MPADFNATFAVGQRRAMPAPFKLRLKSAAAGSPPQAPTVCRWDLQAVAGAGDHRGLIGWRMTGCCKLTSVTYLDSDSACFGLAWGMYQGIENVSA